jgi:hypothetical protein
VLQKDTVQKISSEFIAGRYEHLCINAYRDAGTTGAAGASAPLAFCIFNFVGAVRVQIMGVTGA